MTGTQSAAAVDASARYCSECAVWLEPDGGHLGMCRGCFSGLTEAQPIARRRINERIAIDVCRMAGLNVVSAFDRREVRVHGEWQHIGRDRARVSTEEFYDFADASDRRWRTDRVAVDDARNTDDLRWLWNDAEAALGMSAIEYQSIDSSDCAADGPDSKPRNGVIDVAWGKAAQTFAVVVQEPSEWTLRQAGRINRIYQILALVPRRSVRILQRRFDAHYFPHLDIYFGEWSGIVDYISDLNSRLRPRSGAPKPVRAQFTHWASRARKEFDAAMVEYGAAQVAYDVSWRRDRREKLMLSAVGGSR